MQFGRMQFGRMQYAPTGSGFGNDNLTPNIYNTMQSWRCLAIIGTLAFLLVQLEDYRVFR